MLEAAAFQAGAWCFIYWKQMGDLYTIVESEYHRKWFSWIYKVKLVTTLNWPIRQLFLIINHICNQERHHNNMAARFGCKDSNRLEFFINRIYSKTVLLKDIWDNEYFTRIFEQVCGMILNSNKNWELFDGTGITAVHLIEVPFEWMVQLAHNGRFREKYEFILLVYVYTCRNNCLLLHIFFILK